MIVADIYFVYTLEFVSNMSVSAISSVYSSYQSYEYQYFGATISESKFTALMQKYGITQTGNAYNDVQALYSAMSGNADTEVAGSVASQNSQQANQPAQETEAKNSSNIPWANLMSRIGLAATGDLSADYEAFDNKISQMQDSAAASSQQQALISQLIAEASVVFVNNQVAQTQDSTQSQAQVSGSDIVAKLNRMFLLG